MNNHINDFLGNNRSHKYHYYIWREFIKNNKPKNILQIIKYKYICKS